MAFFLTLSLHKFGLRQQLYLIRFEPDARIPIILELTYATLLAAFQIRWGSSLTGKFLMPRPQTVFSELQIALSMVDEDWSRIKNVDSQSKSIYQEELRRRLSSDK